MSSFNSPDLVLLKRSLNIYVYPFQTQDICILTGHDRILPTCRQVVIVCQHNSAELFCKDFRKGHFQPLQNTYYYYYYYLIQISHSKCKLKTLTYYRAESELSKSIIHCKLSLVRKSVLSKLGKLSRKK
jgi:hypothetical protein